MLGGFECTIATYVQLKQITAKVSKPKILETKISYLSTNHFDKLG